MRRAILLCSVVALLGLMLAAPPPGVAATDATGTVRVEVRYRTESGRQPLVGVSVWLGIDPGPDMSGCTGAEGVVEFLEVPVDTDLVSATGPGFGDGCTNPYFLNPDTGKEMTTVYWDGHHGEFVLDTFVVGDGETLTLRYVVRTPHQHEELCNGLWATWLGTSGPDRFTGTSDLDIVNARSGNDTIRGGGGMDLICGAKGDDTLLGGAWYDVVWGGPGDDELIGGSGPDVLVGGPGHDRCRGEDTYECE